MSLFLHRSAILGGGGGSSPLIAVSYDDIDYTEIGTGTAGAAERTIPTGVTNLTLTSSDLQGTAAGNILRLQFGFNDGVSTTWYTTSGDYRRNLESDIANSVTDRDDIHVFEDASGSTLSRPHAWSLSADCLHLAVPTTVVGCEYFNDASPGSTNDGAFLTHVMTDAVVINRFRVFWPVTTSASGSIRVKYETRPVEIISTIDVSAMGNSTSIAVSGYSSVRIVSTDTTLSGTSSFVGVRLATDGVPTFDATSGNYKFTFETGSTTSNGNTTVLIADSQPTTSSKAYTIEIQNLDVAAPTISFASEIVTGAVNRNRWWGIHTATDDITHLQLIYGDARTGTGGTAYIVGDTTPSVLIASPAISSYTDPGTIVANPNPVVSHSVASYGRITACAFTATTAEAVQIFARASDDNGSTFETSGYSYKIEDGTDESQRSETGAFYISSGTAGTSTNASFLMFLENVNLLAPAFGWGCQFATSGKSGTMHKASTALTNFGMMFWNAASTDHVAGSTGTVYLVGRE